MKIVSALALWAVALVVILVLAPFSLAAEFRRPAGEPLPPWWGTVIGRRQRHPLVAAVLFAAVGGLATLANLTAK
ncbi:MAG TPA: hypothetical protein VM597_35865 [Gemmataceae bacterium]|jgi:hypothetical protein|nr:hypothetical protein [Gemmataceae bacterium]